MQLLESMKRIAPLPNKNNLFSLFAACLVLIIAAFTPLHKTHSTLDSDHNSHTCAVCVLQQTIGTALPVDETLLPIVDLVSQASPILVLPIYVGTERAPFSPRSPPFLV